MKTRIAILAIVALLLGGCASYKLPAITASEISYHRTDPIGGTQINATNVKVTDEAVTADEASWVTTYPSFSVSVQVKGYERKLTPQEKK